MVKGTVAVTAKGDPNILKKIMADLGNLDVYVGIPEADSSRGDINKKNHGSLNRKDEKINNAELAYIHTHGIRAGVMRKEMQPAIDSGKPYSKAYEMYIQAHGSPLWQSPPRPIIEPAIEKNKDAIAEKLKPAMRHALNGDKEAALMSLERAGMFAANKAKAYFTDPENGWPENSPATIKAKGSDRPLIDTGALRQAITYVVGEKDD
jgi:hypothetical protein